MVTVLPTIEVNETNVPLDPGVPPVVNPAPSTPPVLMTQDTVSQFSAVFGPQWGIFQGGAPKIVAESVASFEFRQDWTISDYPVEGGKFESYDKVLTPYLAKIRFAQGGSPSARAAFLASVEAAAATLDVYDAVTPEHVYRSCNISHYDYRRMAQQGLGLIVVDIWVTQVVAATSNQLTDVQNPSSADTVSSGAVQPTPFGGLSGNLG